MRIILVEVRGSWFLGLAGHLGPRMRGVETFFFMVVPVLVGICSIPEV